ncbi:MAG: prephenate dehydratase [Acidobacteria bacterium]|nr:prephenate dehydratase [Acidobacteriota bacterium]
MKKQMRAAFQGELGAFSQIAVRQLLGEDAVPVACERFEQVFRSLKEGRVERAVVPIENTLHGSIHENYDHLLNFDLEITGETSVRIVHNLIAAPGVKWNQIRRVLSHPVALNQCLKFFAANPHLERVTHYDTAGSVKTIMEEKATDAAAIASAVASEIYGAHILKRSIEDDRQNYTRFFLLERPAKKRAGEGGGERKTSLVFTTRNTPGALFRALSAFALRDLSLTKIESRPLRGKPFEYLFYVDVLADVADAKMQKALGHLEELADFLRVLGCYPRGK